MIKLKTRLPLYFLRKTILLQIILCMLFLAHAAQAQQAAFTSTVTSGCRPLTVAFNATAAGNTRWEWKFDNGNTSQGSAPVNQAPSAIYTKPGTYTVELTVTGPGGARSTATKTIEVYANPKVSFSFDKTSGCAPVAVQFTDKSTAGSGYKNKWAWSFGDGEVSSETDPSHVYSESGPPKYVTLRVTNVYGCDSAVTASTPIQVLGPKAAFNVPTPTFCQAPAHAQFENNSTGDAPLSYQWIFGDGGESTSVNHVVTHDYLTADVFHPSLTVTDGNGCTRTATSEVRTSGEGGLRVTPSKSKICLGETIGFTVDSDIPIDFGTYEWDFGNGTGSVLENPTVAYSASTDAGKTFTVVLSAHLANKNCNSVVSFPVEVVAQPIPKFTYKVACDYSVTFTNTSTSAARIQWVINDGPSFDQNTFTYPFVASGPQSVKLTVYNAANCAQPLTQTITIPPKPVASFKPDKDQDCIEASLSGCAPFTVDFVNTSTPTDNYTSRWTFSDGTILPSNDQNVTRTFTKKGDYAVKLDITSKGTPSCTASVTKIVSVRDVIPTPNFSISKPEACAKEPISFTDLSANANFWCWNFGDGGTATVQNPTHSYQKPGVYSITLTAKNAGCSASITLTDAITIKDPFVDFEVTKSCGNPYEVTITTDSNADVFEWDFDDGSPKPTDKNVNPHQYGQLGDYDITLTGTSTTTQCVVKATKRVSIYDIDAKFHVDVDNPCKGAPVSFIDESQSAASWTWSFDNGQQNDAQQNPSTTFDQARQYTVKLVAKDKDGCEDSETLVIDVLDITGAFTFQGVSDCKTLTANFTDLSTASPGIEEWEWDYGDGSPHYKYKATDPTYTPPSHPYTVLGSYPITLTLTNGEGTCKYVQRDAIQFTIPTVDFKADKPGNCINGNIQFTNQSFNARNFSWDFGYDGRTSRETHPRTSYDKTGKYTITLWATDQYQCSLPATKIQYISITKPVAAFEALDAFVKCPPLTPNFKDKSTGNVVSWAWNSGDGQQSSIQSPAFTYNKPGEFDVTLTATDVNGCSDVVVAPKVVFVGGPSGTFSLSTPGPYCLNDSVTFTAKTINAVSHEWDFGDGTVTMQPGMIAGHRYTQTGTFHIALTLRSLDPPCPLSADGLLELSIQDTAKIDFKFPPCVFTGEESSFEVAEPQDDLTYTWMIDGEAAGNGQQLPAIINDPGKHNVVLNALTQYGCGSKTTYDVAVQGDVVFVPNVFTPNDDNLNAEFQVLGVERSTWDLKVFNRWGEPVFEQRDYKNTWRANGVATGVYYYLLKNAICPGREYKGVISIIR